MTNPLPTEEQIYHALQHYNGNKSAAARHLGIYRGTLRELIHRYGMGTKPFLSGQISQLPINKLPLPAEGSIKRYLLTSAQNNTHVHKKFLANLIAYKDWLGNCELMISRFMYNKTAFNNDVLAKAGRGPTDSDHGQAVYDPAILEYVCDDPALHGSCRYQLAPDLQWCAEANILPTNVDPLSGRDTYAGHSSAIFPHAKFALKSQPRMPDEPARFLYTTGAVTVLNYIQRNAGQKAEFHHCMGAVVVEVNSNGDWWARSINADKKGAFYDCPNGSVTYVSDGVLTTGHESEGINWGDQHAVEIDPEVAEVNWGIGGAIDCLRPRKQFANDLLSFRSQSHHEQKKFGKRLEKYINQQDNVSDELDATYNLLQKAYRPWCQTVVVNSNHDRHGERWLDEADYRHDLPNCEFFLEAQLARVKAIKAGEGWNFLEWSMRRRGDTKTRFLGQDESYCIGPAHHRVECGLHGDAGPNGSRGSTRNLAKLGTRSNKGHDHTATVFEGTHSAGVCQLDLGYNHGPTSWSVSHVLTYKNGKRSMLSQRAGRLWA